MDVSIDIVFNFLGGISHFTNDWDIYLTNVNSGPKITLAHTRLVVEFKKIVFLLVLSESQCNSTHLPYVSRQISFDSSSLIQPRHEPQSVRTSIGGPNSSSRSGRRGSGTAQESLTFCLVPMHSSSVPMLAHGPSATGSHGTETSSQTCLVRRDTSGKAGRGIWASQYVRGQPLAGSTGRVPVRGKASIYETECETSNYWVHPASRTGQWGEKGV